jgi:predicted choloylglycine hydrolase
MMGAEEEMKLWVKEFIAEVDRIEAFYMKHYEEYRQEYENLNSRYILKKNDKDDLPNTNVNSNNMI